MLPYIDVYVLVADRSVDLVDRFLARFAPLREESRKEYEIPQFSEKPTHLFKNATDVIAYCVAHPCEPQSVYWRIHSQVGPKHAMVFFTPDKEIILGLSTSEKEADDCLLELQAFAGTNLGCICLESPPPESAAAFRKTYTK